MKLGDLFYPEWVCAVSFSDPCLASDKKKNPSHVHCGYRYRADINEWEYEKMKDIKIL